MKQLVVRLSQKAKNLLKRGTNVAAAALIMGGMVVASTPSAHAQNALAAPRVSFTFDDGYESFITKAAPTLQAQGYVGTAYATTSFIGTAGFMTWAQVQSLQNDWGWEIGGHTVTHPLSTEITAEQLEQEMAQSKADLEAHDIDATSFATPFGDYNDAVQAASARYFTSHRGFHDIGENVWPYNDQLLVNQQIQAGVSVDTVKGYIDSAIANNSWLILTFHDIKDTPSTDPEDYEYATADLAEIAAYVKSKNIAVSTVRDGLLTGTNKLTGGNFDNGIADGWSTDAPTEVVADNTNKGSVPTPGTSVSMTAGATNTHLFSPFATVNPANTYVIKSYVHLTNPPLATGDEISFFVDEYNANGDWINGKYVQGITRSADANPSYVRNVNFAYVPSSAEVKQVRLQVIVTANSGIQAYVDNIQLFSIGDDGVVNPPADTTPAGFSNVAAGNITTTSATISWNNDEPTTGVVRYGTTKDLLDGSAASATLSASHSVTLTGLLPNTNYQYQVVATDAAGNVSGTAAGDYNFTTLAETGQDETGPVISNVNVDVVGNTAAWITWNTDEITTSRIDFGTSTAYDQYAENILPTLTPWFNLTNLVPDTTYYFKLTSTDLAGNVSTYEGTFSTAVELTPGDLNGDGAVNLNDLSILSSNWGREPATAAQGDLNGDGKINLNDLSILSSNWSKK